MGGWATTRVIHPASTPRLPLLYTGRTGVRLSSPRSGVVGPCGRPSSFFYLQIPCNLLIHTLHWRRPTSTNTNIAREGPYDRNQLHTHVTPSSPSHASNHNPRQIGNTQHDRANLGWQI